MAWFLDTNACITYLRDTSPQLSARWQQHRADELAIPLPVYAELLLGAEKSNRRDRVLGEVQSLLLAHRLVELNDDVAQQYARVRADLEPRGLMIGNNDVWIAATALAHGAVLVTNNTDEFSRVANLSIEDWTQ